MRHFLIKKLVPLPLAVTGLSRGVQAPGAVLRAVLGARAADRLAPLDGAALDAKALAAITRAAEAKLDAASGTERKSEGGDRQGAPRRRLLDLEPDL